MAWRVAVWRQFYLSEPPYTPETESQKHNKQLIINTIINLARLWL